MSGPDEARLVVECDGFDFHERTKEQASRDRRRDRALQRAGFKVYRYTGSDIWADALGFSDKANLDAGNMWPTDFALTKLTAAEEKKIAALVKKAMS